jgi:hypothetical protein
MKQLHKVGDIVTFADCPYRGEGYMHIYGATVGFVKIIDWSACRLSEKTLAGHDFCDVMRMRGMCFRGFR